jgi:hypothetical protein
LLASAASLQKLSASERLRTAKARVGSRPLTERREFRESYHHRRLAFLIGARGTERAKAGSKPGADSKSINIGVASVMTINSDLYSFCSEFHEVTQVFQLSAPIDGDSRDLRITVLRNPASNSFWASIDILGDFTLQPDYPGPQTSEQIWVRVSEFSSADTATADEAIAGALNFLRDRG